MYKEVAVILLLAVAGLPMANAQTKASANAKAAAAPVASPLKPGLWEITLLNETPGSNSKKSVVARACTPRMRSGRCSRRASRMT